jgi:hypothetical protein
MPTHSLISTGCLLVLMLPVSIAAAQTPSAASRMRPLGAPSAVDRFSRPADSSARSPSNVRQTRAVQAQPVSATAGSNLAGQATRVRNETAYWQTDASADRSASRSQTPAVRQTVWMQQSGLQAPPINSMPLPGETAPSSPTGGSGGSNAPSAGSNQGRGLPNSAPYPDANGGPATSASGQGATPNAPPPRMLPQPSAAAPPANFGPGNAGAVPSASDMTPVPQPQLPSSGFATMSNCHLVTGPTRYLAASGIGCGCGPVIPTNYAAPVTSAPATAAPPTAYPAEIPSAATTAPVTVLPPTTTTPPRAATGAPARALISLGQETYPVQVGQGLWGQPVAYVPGQGIRNWLRYFFP